LKPEEVWALTVDEYSAYTEAYSLAEIERQERVVLDEYSRLKVNATDKKGKFINRDYIKAFGNDFEEMREKVYSTFRTGQEYQTKEQLENTSRRERIETAHERQLRLDEFLNGNA
jgi:hypothetical protein